MKKKTTFAALIWAVTFALSGCGDKSENASESVVSVALPDKIDIFNIENQSDMAVTLYYDVEEPTIAFIMPDGTTLETDELPTERGKGAVCYHIADAVPGQWK
ncbi:MAG: hypothetical protein OSJ43_14435, partial [Oscillospiraceae bacterium]|nr:hypothetical protein [Oscillospiraceae bacterium]